MKIAVCASGQLRTFPKLASHFMERFEGCDFYFSVWDSEAFDDIQLLMEFKPIAMEIEQHSTFRRPIAQVNNKPPEMHNIDNAQSMFYKIYRANKLRIASGISYDVVIRTRFDLQYGSDIPFQDFTDGSLHIPEGEDHRGGLNDQFSAATPEIMNKYCMLYENLHMIHNEWGVWFHPETMNRVWCEKQGINVRRFGHTLIYSIVRP